MPRSHPDTRTLIGVALDYLESGIYPALKGAERYRTRVALNVLRIVQREIEHGASHDAAEAAELQGIADLTAGGDAHTLADRIEGGQADLDDPRLADFLRRSLARALAINNPRWTRGDATSKETP